MEGKVGNWLTVGANVYGNKENVGVAGVAGAFQYLTISVPGIYPGEPGKYGIPASAEESTTANNVLTILTVVVRMKDSMQHYLAILLLMF